MGCCCIPCSFSCCCWPCGNNAETTKKKVDAIKEILRKDINVVDGESNEIIFSNLKEHISQLLEPKKEHQEPSTSTWRNGLDMKKIAKFVSSGLEFVSDLKDIVPESVQTILKVIGKASVATAGILVIAYALERYEDYSANKIKCLALLKEMSDIAYYVPVLKRSPNGSNDIIKDATKFIVKGAMTCCTQMGSSTWKNFFSASKNKKDLESTEKKLSLMYSKISTTMINDVRDAVRKAPLCREYPEDTVGLDESVQDVLDILKREEAKNAFTIILHGCEGMGKTILARAVISQIVEYQYSEVKLFQRIESPPNIEELQMKILGDLMGPEKPNQDIRMAETGKQVLANCLKEVDAFIYIDNVLKASELQRLLPRYMDTAKKVRLLLTAREVEDLKEACPKPFKVYSVKGIQRPDAMIILKKEISEGIKESQFNEIIERCRGSPGMLTSVAQFIGRALDKEIAYDILIQDKGTWGSAHTEAHKKLSQEKDRLKRYQKMRSALSRGSEIDIHINIPKCKPNRRVSKRQGRKGNYWKTSLC